ncbi:hypothetical protein EDD22DRAFT_855033 [Suillus occidentalis]|nr:hypothetical protein EDD22DRAFT_855033 [Suillus occidentalis]
MTCFTFTSASDAKINAIEIACFHVHPATSMALPSLLLPLPGVYRLLTPQSKQHLKAAKGYTINELSTSNVKYRKKRKLITVTKTRVVCFDSDGKISTESTRLWKRTRPYPTQELVPTPHGLRVVAILASEGSSSARTANGWLSCYSPTSSATRMTHDNGLITLGQDVTILDERRMGRLVAFTSSIQFEDEVSDQRHYPTECDGVNFFEDSEALLEGTA